jgi:hypothetical protein
MQAARLVVCVANDNNNVHTLYRPRQQVTATVPLKSFYALWTAAASELRGIEYVSVTRFFTLFFQQTTSSSHVGHV